VSSVDAVIVAYQNARTIGDCVESALSIDGLGVVVVVDHGNDESGTIAESLGAKVIHDFSNPGFGAGQNRGRTLSSAEFVLILNPDAVIHRGAVEEGIEFLRSNPKAAAAEGIIVDLDSGEPERSAGRALGALHLWGRALGLKRFLKIGLVRSVARRVPALSDHVNRFLTANAEVETLSATALLVRAKALEMVGGFDETFFMYGEDTDLCLRMRKSGWQLYALPIPWATHRWGTSTGDSITREILWWQGAMRFAARWYGPGSWASAIAAATLRSMSLSASNPRRCSEVFNSVVRHAIRVRQTGHP
jgi:N-acetylglucosaminyl-diphospho-decaprenol L-rhamnosyltransferase